MNMPDQGTDNLNTMSYNSSIRFVTYTSKKTLAIVLATAEIHSILQNRLGYIFHLAV